MIIIFAGPRYADGDCPFPDVEDNNNRAPAVRSFGDFKAAQGETALISEVRACRCGSNFSPCAAGLNE